MNEPTPIESTPTIVVVNTDDLYDYEHTHVSVLDGSPAMLVSQSAETITLVNEDGFEWTDPATQWRPIPASPKS